MLLVYFFVLLVGYLLFTAAPNSLWACNWFWMVKDEAPRETNSPSSLESLFMNGATSRSLPNCITFTESSDYIMRSAIFWLLSFCCAGVLVVVSLIELCCWGFCIPSICLNMLMFLSLWLKVFKNLILLWES